MASLYSKIGGTLGAIRIAHIIGKPFRSPVAPSLQREGRLTAMLDGALAFFEKILIIVAMLLECYRLVSSLKMSRAI